MTITGNQQFLFEELMRDLAAAIDLTLKDNIGEKGWALLVFDFNQPGIANYVSNANREDMIKMLRETADRLENNEDIPEISNTIH